MIGYRSRSGILPKQGHLQDKICQILVCILLFLFPFTAYPQENTKSAKPETIKKALSDADGLDRAGKSEDAINAYSDILKTSPENEDALEARGALYLRIKDSDKAVADFSLLILRRPKEYAYWFNRALCERQKRKYLEAISDINQALSLNSKDQRILTTRANIYLDMDDIPLATADVDRALKDFGPTARTSVAKSVLCFRAFDTDCLLSTSEQAIRADSTDGAAVNNHAYGLILKGDLDGAMKDLAQAERIDPYWSLPPNNKALIYILRKQWEKAAEELEKAKNRNPVMAEIFLNQGLLKFGRGNLVEALDAFDRAVALSPNLASAYLNRARVRFAQQEFVRALEDVNIAFKLNSRSAESVLLRSKIESKLGKNEDSEKDLGLAKSIRESYPFAEIKVDD